MKFPTWKPRVSATALVTAVPIIFVNIVAFAGQYGYIHDHLNWPTIGQVIMALALESIAIFLAYMAHQALMAEDTAYGLRMASYAFGVLIGLMNYSHYAGPDWRPTFVALVTGGMSMASPWLWGIYSRRVSRDALKARGLIEPRAVKLGALRWLLWTDSTWKVFRRAVWLGVHDPKTAVDGWEGIEATDWASDQEWEDAMNEAAEHTAKDYGLPTEPPPPFPDALVVGESIPVTGPEVTNGQEILEAHSKAIKDGYPAATVVPPKIIPVKPRTAKPPAFQPVDDAIVPLEGMPKAEHVRRMLKRYPDASPGEIVSLLAAEGVYTTPSYVSNIKYKDSKRNAMP